MEQFSDLIQSGLKTREAIELTFSQADRILTLLEEGIPFEDILTGNRKGRFFEMLGDLLAFCELPEALKQALALEKGSSGLLDTLLKNSIYPLFLLIFSWLLLWFFDLMILPSMQVYSEGSDFLVVDLLLVFFTALLAGLLLLGIGWLTYQREWPFFSILHRRMNRILFLQKVHALQISLLLRSLLEAGLSGGRSLRLLRKMKSARRYGRWAGVWEKKMEEGTSFLQAVMEQEELDPLFKRTMQIGVESGRLPWMLENYASLVQKQLEQKVRKLSVVIQCLSYGCVGTLCLSVYQIMLAPLNMLSTI